MRILWCFVLLSGIAFSRTEFWAPLAPPRAHYSANVKYNDAASRLEGTETIHFRNESGRPIGRVALRWFGDTLSLAANGTPLHGSPARANVTLFDLPQDLAPGAEIALSVTFGAAWKLGPKTGNACSAACWMRKSRVSTTVWPGSAGLQTFSVWL